MAKHTILGGKVHIYQRTGSPKWQCATYLNGKNHRTTTKTESLSQAKDFAEDWYLTLRDKNRRGKRRKLPRRDRVPARMSERPMQRWSMDFISDQLGDHRRFRVLNIVDDHSRLCPGQIVYVSISARIARFLDDLALRLSLPEEIALDNGPEGTSRAMFDWSERTGVRLRFIELRKPVQNAFVESFNGKFRDECLNLHWFNSLRHAREAIARWRAHYNTERPRSAICHRRSS